MPTDPKNKKNGTHERKKFYLIVFYTISNFFYHEQNKNPPVSTTRVIKSTIDDLEKNIQKTTNEISEESTSGGKFSRDTAWLHQVVLL